MATRLVLRSRPGENCEIDRKRNNSQSFSFPTTLTVTVQEGLPRIPLSDFALRGATRVGLRSPELMLGRATPLTRCVRCFRITRKACASEPPPADCDPVGGGEGHCRPYQHNVPDATKRARHEDCRRALRRRPSNGNFRRRFPNGQVLLTTRRLVTLRLLIAIHRPRRR